MKSLALKIGNDVIVAPSGVPTGGMGFGSTGEKIIQTGIILLVLGGIFLALAFLILGGIQWTTSGGDKQQLQNARNKLIYAVFGLIIIFLAIFIVNFIGNVFGVELLKLPSAPLYYSYPY